MKLAELSNPKILSALYLVGTSINVLGSPGIGKSAVVRQIPKILSDVFGETFGYREELVPSLEAPDVRGFMVPAKNADGVLASQFTYPAILPSQAYLHEHPRGVIFFDEFAQGDPLTQKGLAPMILEGAVGQYRLPPGWLRITASNRVQDRSGAAKPMMHIVNRQTTIEIENDVGGWVAWANEYRNPQTQRQLHPMAIAFARKFPKVLFSDMPNEAVAFCTPRSYVAAWDLISALTEVDEHGYMSMKVPNDAVMWSFVAGSVGNGAATQMQAFVKVANEIPEFTDILKDPLHAHVPGVERLDAAYSVMQMCLQYLDQKTLKPVWTYLQRLPRELQVTIANQIMANSRLSGHLLGSPDFTKWLSKNTALLQHANS